MSTRPLNEHPECADNADRPLAPAEIDVVAAAWAVGAEVRGRCGLATTTDRVPRYRTDHGWLDRGAAGPGGRPRRSLGLAA